MCSSSTRVSLSVVHASMAYFLFGLRVPRRRRRQPSLNNHIQMFRFQRAATRTSSTSRRVSGPSAPAAWARWCRAGVHSRASLQRPPWFSVGSVLVVPAILAAPPAPCGLWGACRVPPRDRAVRAVRAVSRPTGLPLHATRSARPPSPPLGSGEPVPEPFPPSSTHRCRRASPPAMPPGRARLLGWQVPPLGPFGRPPPRGAPAPRPARPWPGDDDGWSSDEGDALSRAEVVTGPTPLPLPPPVGATRKEGDAAAAGAEAGSGWGTAAGAPRTDGRGAVAVPPPFEDVWGTLGTVGGVGGEGGWNGAGLHMPVRFGRGGLAAPAQAVRCCGWRLRLSPWRCVCLFCVCSRWALANGPTRFLGSHLVRRLFSSSSPSPASPLAPARLGAPPPSPLSGTCGRPRACNSAKSFTPLRSRASPSASTWMRARAGWRFAGLGRTASSAAASRGLRGRWR